VAWFRRSSAHRFARHLSPAHRWRPLLEVLERRDLPSASAVQLLPYSPPLALGLTFYHGPSLLTAVGRSVFFDASVSVPGEDPYFGGPSFLWRTDGTPEGTVQIAPTPAGSMVNVDGTLFFAGDDSDYHAHLWKNNGTRAGTVVVKDINPGTRSFGFVDL